MQLHCLPAAFNPLTRWDLFMRQTLDFNDDWLFEGTSLVRLPHTAVELPYSYFDETLYQRAFTYEKTLTVDPSWSGQEVWLRFDGAMADARVSIDGVLIAAHRDGYTPFTARLTDIAPGEHTICVTIDGTENPESPPFGNVLDYLTYAGLYREAWLELAPALYISNVKIETPQVLALTKRVTVQVHLDNPRNLTLQGEVRAEIWDAKGTIVAQSSTTIYADEVTLLFEGLQQITLWSTETPTLYSLRLTLTSPFGEDSLTTRFGFREVAFTADGFHLNGQKIKLRGLNRHQSFPHVGYALGRAAQARDAEILKQDLRVNMVRTSHYPQSGYFLDRCDELGLLVFEEIPGWQHIGGLQWQDEAVMNVARMITRDWNHPSIVIWGVRINESADNHDFYKRTNALAHELDATRPTGGVRYSTDSQLLEDVYTMNDFILGNEEMGGNRPRTPLRPQAEVTGLPHQVPYMITEFGGHMYPTKSTDPEQRQAEHVIRHLEVLNAMYGDPQIAGAIGWCAFDYNTHKDFGSGDRICHHGVMDMYREPKFAAHVYASQGAPEGGIVLEPVTYWARGERNIGGVLPLIILTNCDEVELRYGAHSTPRIAPDRDRFPHLPHPPVILDHRTISADQLGLWGMEWLSATITGYLGGKSVATKHFVSNPVPTTLQVVPDAFQIGAHDAVRIMIRMLDQAGNKLPFLPEPVTVTVTGPAKRFGPATLPLRAGSTGVWLQAQGIGEISVTVSQDRVSSTSVQILAH
jgi:beta-galactosidase